MRLKSFAVLALAAMPLFAGTTLFSRYESVRQGLLKEKVADVRSAANALATAAKAEKNADVAKAAAAVAAAKDLEAARDAFGALSDEMIKVRNAATGDRPVIGFCPMVNKSWLQQRGAVSNPYGKLMEKCGVLKD